MYRKKKNRKQIVVLESPYDGSSPVKAPPGHSLLSQIVTLETRKRIRKIFTKCIKIFFNETTFAINSTDL